MVLSCSRALTSKADKIHTEVTPEHSLQPALAELPGEWRWTRPTGWPLSMPGALRPAQGESVLGKGPGSHVGSEVRREDITES